MFAWALEARPSNSDAPATTLAFTTFVLFQFVNAVSARVEHTTVFSRHLLRTGKLWLALSGVLALQVAAVQIPAFGGLVDVVPMDWQLWVLAAATASSLLIAEEVQKLIHRS